MIDTHAHIYLPEFSEEIVTLLEEAWENGVEEIFLPAINFDSLSQMQQLPEHNVKLHKMIGIHPCDVLKVVEEIGDVATTLDKIENELRANDYCAVGEIGLDYYWDATSQGIQKEMFRGQIHLAKQFDLPFVIHNRDSTTDMLKILEEEYHSKMKGIWHCFNGTVEEGRLAIDLGMYLGIGGVVTFKNAGVDKVVSELPLDRMVLETDSPYLTPAPHRGKKNYPKYIKLISEKLAQIKGLDAEEIASIADQNVRNVFG